MGRRLRVRQRHRRRRPGVIRSDDRRPSRSSVGTHRRPARAATYCVAAGGRGVDRQRRPAPPAGNRGRTSSCCATTSPLQHCSSTTATASGMVVITDRAEQDDMINRVERTDLVLVPAHIVHDTPPWRLRRHGTPPSGHEHCSGRRAAPFDDLAGRHHASVVDGDHPATRADRATCKSRRMTAGSDCHASGRITS